MKPGRGLDVFVYEKVFGNAAAFTTTEPTMLTATEVLARSRIGFYSTDISAAWEVVEKMHEHPKPVLMLVAPQQDYNNEKWRAEFSRKGWDEKSPYHYAASAETAPHVICLAALRFFGLITEEQAQQ